MSSTRRHRGAGAAGAVTRVAVAPRGRDLAAAFAAAYRLLDRAYVHFERDAGGAVSLGLRPKGRQPGLDLAALFADEVREQRRQLALAEHNTRLQEAVVGRALFGDSSTDSWDERADEGGAVPWADEAAAPAPSGGPAGGEGTDP